MATGRTVDTDLDEFLDIRRYGFVRVAAGSPKTHRSQPLKCAEEHWKMTLEAYDEGAQVIVFPELGMSGGYFQQDLHLQRQLHNETEAAITWFLLQQRLEKLNAIVVFGASIVIGDGLYNGAFVTLRGTVLGILLKTYLPNYGEFTERRWFCDATQLNLKEIQRFGQTIQVGNDLLFYSKNDPDFVMGGEICEDGWMSITPATLAALNGALLNFNISGSNFGNEKQDWRLTLAQRSGIDITATVYAGAGYGESSTALSFDGPRIIAERGVILKAETLYETYDQRQLTLQDVDLRAARSDRMRTNTWQQQSSFFGKLFPYRRIGFSLEEGQLGTDAPGRYSEFIREFDTEPFVPKSTQEMMRMHMARVMGLRTRLEHLPAGKRQMVLGLSGGLDSADTLMIGYRVVDMFGHELGLTPKNIICITMPGFGTSQATYDYATNLANELGVTFREISIRELATMLANATGHPDLINKIELEQHLSLLFENNQVWARKLIELAVATAEGGIILGSTSASEAFIGWFTLFGDGSSHYAPNVGMGKSAVRKEMFWLADILEESQPQLSAILRGIASSASSPELLLLGKGGEVVQKSEELNGPDSVRDFFVYHMLRFYREPLTVYRMAVHAYRGQYSPRDLHRWLARFIYRFFVNWFKMNMQSIDTVKVGAVAPGAHDFTKIPSDISPELWLKDLDGIPEEFRAK